MKTIYKYRLSIEEEQTIEMPEGAEVLTVQTQGGVPCVWAKLDHEKPLKVYKFVLIGTGHCIEDGFEGKYIGTFQKQGGTLVFHLFLEE